MDRNQLIVLHRQPRHDIAAGKSHDLQKNSTRSVADRKTGRGRGEPHMFLAVSAALHRHLSAKTRGKGRGEGRDIGARVTGPPSPARGRGGGGRTSGAARRACSYCPPKSPEQSPVI